MFKKNIVVTILILVNVSLYMLIQPSQTVIAQGYESHISQQDYKNEDIRVDYTLKRQKSKRSFGEKIGVKGENKFIQTIDGKFEIHLNNVLSALIMGSVFAIIVFLIFHFPPIVALFAHASIFQVIAFVIIGAMSVMFDSRDGIVMSFSTKPFAFNGIKDQ